MISHLVGAISFHFLFLQDFSLEKEDEGGGRRLFQFLIAPGKTPDAAYRAIYILLLRLLSSRIMRVLPHPGSHNLVPKYVSLSFPPHCSTPPDLILSRSKWPRNFSKLIKGLLSNLNFPSKLSRCIVVSKGKRQSLSLFPFLFKSFSSN